MRAKRAENRTARDASKENPSMSKRFTTTTALLGAAALLLCALPTASASAAEGSPWWQVLSGSRPSNLWEPADAEETQEVTTEKSGTIFAAAVEVGGSVVGCLGAGEFGFFPPKTPANTFCEEQTGFPASEDAAEFEAMLEAPSAYGAGEAQVSGGPAGGAPFEVSSEWGVPPLKFSPLAIELVPGFPVPLGSVSSEITSQGSGRLFLTATNLGDAPLDASSTPVTIEDQLPEGVAAYAAEGVAGAQTSFGEGKAGTVECELPSSSEVSCDFEGVLPSYEAIEVEVFVALKGSPPSVGGPGKVTVSGGNAPEESASQPLSVSPDPVPFGFEQLVAQAEALGGEAADLGGAHPFQLVTTVQLNSGAQTGADRRHSTIEQPALPRNTKVKLPAGLVGDPTAVPTCPMPVFLAAEPENPCPEASVVGVASITIIEKTNYGLIRLGTPIFSLPPAHGEPARFGFLAVQTPVTIDAEVDPEDSYRIAAGVINAPQTVQFLAGTFSLWGWPADPRHDTARGENCFLFRGASYPGVCGEPLAGAGEKPFLRVPVACDSALEFTGEAEPWNTPLGNVISTRTAFSPALRGCNHEPFNPRFALVTTSTAAESPTGLDAEVAMPNALFESTDYEAASEAQFKKAEVTLPEGVTVNPSEAEGLGTCSPADYARERFDSGPGEGCPEASKIGSLKIKTPLLEEEAEGALYIATPHDNPFDSLIALYMVARIPDRGILVKQAGVVRPDPDTGQLVTTFDDVPQIPIDYFKLHFREGARAPLVTPNACGTFQTKIRYTPWSAHDPDNPAPGEQLEQSVPFTIERGVGGGPCPSGGAPFNPGFEAGSESNSAARYSPFTMRLTRDDGDQDLTRFSARLPLGMIANLSGVEQCSDAAIAGAKGKSGVDEKNSPSCPAGSQIGNVTAGAGVGSLLTYVSGKLYLAGPWNGAPLSVVAIVPAVAGPFDVGTVVTREALRIDPRTAEVEADGSSSDPIPHILAGIPLKVRDIRVDVDRDRFTLNPTSCEEMQTEATIWSGGENVFSSADDVAHSASARFQAADCRALGFKSRVGLTLLGGIRRGAFPALKLVYKPRPGVDANLERFAVRFPRSEFIEQGHIRTVCTRVQFAAGAGFGAKCPKRSVYGHVKVWTPILDQPLRGPVYLRSSNNVLPDVVLALHGPPSLPIKLEAPTRIDSVRGGLRAIAWAVPDAPISRVVVRMQGGQKGLLVNSRNICAGKNRAAVSLAAHNGRRSRLRPLVRAVRCKKARRRGKAHRRHRRLSALR